ncbi:MAG: hypothetical protein J6J42_02200 [Lachnospiraceae bacterium]|nr:hypothetical protein [Lachnospiraceae bacterium]MBP3609129.1 hypothetical protein [Lachnospiraceae bacterium]
MKNEKLYDAISDIQEEYIEEAGTFQFRKKRPWQAVKWGSMAACFCLLLLGISYWTGGAFAKKGDNNSNTSAVPTAAPGDVWTVLAYNGSLYNVSNELWSLNKAGIPETITSEDCGRLLGNLAKTEQGYEETTEKTDIEIYEYAPALNSAVLVVKDGEDYMAGLFSNYYQPDEAEAYSPVSELYRVYGIEGAGNIRMVAEAGPAGVDILTGTEVGEKKALEDFYTATMSTELECYGKEEFREMVTDRMTEEEYTMFMETERILCIETVEGLRFYMSWYPESGWLYSGGTMAYYKITEELGDWLEMYMK